MTSRIQTTVRVPDHIEKVIKDLSQATGYSRSVVMRAMLAVAAEIPGAVLTKIHEQL